MAAPAAMRFLLVVLTLAVLAAGEKAPSPTFRFNYAENDVPVSQYYTGPDGSLVYSWGFNFPGRSHSESKDTQGTVSGRFEFVDANGALQQTNYNADPVRGFTVDDDTQPQTAAVALTKVAPIDAQSPLEPNIEEAIMRSSPHLLDAVRSGHLVPLDSTVDGEVIFRVSNSLVDQNQGSVSALAASLDTDLPAARHDSQIYRPSYHFQQDDLTPMQLSSRFNEAPGNVRPLLESIGTANDVQYIVRMPYVPLAADNSGLVTDY